MNRCVILFVRSINGSGRDRRIILSTTTTTSNYSTSSIFVPKYQPLNTDDLGKIREFVTRSQTLFILSGAGISTESGRHQQKLTKQVSSFHNHNYFEIKRYSGLPIRGCWLVRQERSSAYSVQRVSQIGRTTAHVLGSQLRVVAALQLVRAEHHAQDVGDVGTSRQSAPSRHAERRLVAHQSRLSQSYRAARHVVHGPVCRLFVHDDTRYHADSSQTGESQLVGRVG